MVSPGARATTCIEAAAAELAPPSAYARGSGSIFRSRVAAGVRVSARSEPEPARSPGCAELLLFGGVLARRVVALRRRRRAAEEVDLDPADELVAELGVADARPS